MTLTVIGSIISCNKNVPAVEPLSEAQPDASITVNIGLDKDDVKAATSARKDFRINKFQIFVFDANSQLETNLYKEITPVNNSTSAQIATFTGPKTVYVILNHDRLIFNHHTALSVLENTLTDLSLNTNTNLVMSGSSTVNVVKYGVDGGTPGSPQEVDVHVRRLASMIELDQVTVDFTGTSLEGAEFKIKELYLKNVVGKSKLGGGALSDSEQENYSYWYNKGTKASDAPGVTVDTWTKECESSGTATSISRCLYAYPNKTVDDSHADTFDKRHTRLVIKAHVKATAWESFDSDTYYVFDLPVLEANMIYKITSIKLTMLGKDNDDKDDDLQAGKIQPNIKVDPWSGTTNLTYDF